ERLPLPRWATGRAVDLPRRCDSLGRDLRRLTCRAPRGVQTRSVDHKDELPAHPTLFTDPMRLRDLGEREGLDDRRREATGLDQVADLGEGVDRAARIP